VTFDGQIDWIFGKKKTAQEYCCTVTHGEPVKNAILGFLIKNI